MLYSELSDEILSLMDAFDDISGISLQIHDNFKPVYISNTMLKHYGFKSIEEYHRLDSIMELIPEESQQIAQERYDTLMQNGKTEPLILENWGPDHNRITIQIQDKRILLHGRHVALTVIQDISDHVMQTAALTRMAMIDELTGIDNRRSFLSRAEAALIGYPEHGAVLLLDVDRFKHINDTYGHHVGDQVLQSFAQACQSCLRASDLLARLGGDEFIIFAPEIGLEHAVLLAQKINHTINSKVMVEINGKALHVSTSIGVVISAKDDTLLQLMSRADKALYQAKENGRDGYAVYR